MHWSSTIPAANPPSRFVRSRWRRINNPDCGAFFNYCSETTASISHTINPARSIGGLPVGSNYCNCRAWMSMSSGSTKIPRRSTNSTKIYSSE